MRNWRRKLSFWTDGERSRSVLGGATILGPDNTDRGMWRQKTIICQSKWTRARYRGFLLERSIACSLTENEISVEAKSKRDSTNSCIQGKISPDRGRIFFNKLVRVITYKTIIYIKGIFIDHLCSDLDFSIGFLDSIWARIDTIYKRCNLTACLYRVRN